MLFKVPFPIIFAQLVWLLHGLWYFSLKDPHSYWMLQLHLSQLTLWLSQGRSVTAPIPSEASRMSLMLFAYMLISWSKSFVILLPERLQDENMIYPWCDLFDGVLVRRSLWRFSSRRCSLPSSVLEFCCCTYCSTVRLHLALWGLPATLKGHVMVLVVKLKVKQDGSLK